MNVHFAITVFLTGAFATAFLDVWALSLNRILGIPATNWALVGRWVADIPAGNLFHHRSIGSRPSVPQERLLGWLTHYLVGVAYAFIYLLLVQVLAQTPSVDSALLFGVTTVLAPWLILQPGLGMGFFARATTKPATTRTVNLISHLVFGLGLYLGWSLFATVI